MGIVEEGLDFLLALSGDGLVHLFWFTLIFELPRYGLATLALLLLGLGRGSRRASRPSDPEWVRSAAHRTSVVVVGYNEGEAIERCVRSLNEQSISGYEIVLVSDGSEDDMAEVAADLVRRGLAHRVLSTSTRCGKAAGFNLAVSACRGDIIINVDCDCSYDRFAIAEMLAPFADASVGAVCGDIAPRNGGRSLTAQCQEIEYLITISMGKRIAAVCNQVTCISGAFGAFRRRALNAVSGLDVGGGEDLDVTMRLRRAGWRIAFAEDAICYTDVPVDSWVLVRQRMRWERDSVRLRYRKHRRSLDARRDDFLWREALHQWDFLVFNVVGACIFPLYIAWLFATYGTFALTILVAMQLGLLVMDFAVLTIALIVTGRTGLMRYLPVLPAYSLYSGYVMRVVRLAAYLDEWTLFGSRRDGFVPPAVRLIRKW